MVDLREFEMFGAPAAPIGDSYVSKYKKTLCESKNQFMRHFAIGEKYVQMEIILTL